MELCNMKNSNSHLMTKFCIMDDNLEFALLKDKNDDNNEYLKMCVDNNSYKIFDSLLTFNFYDNDIIIENAIEICRLNKVNMFKILYRHKKELVHSNITDLFLTSIENVYCFSHSNVKTELINIFEIIMKYDDFDICNVDELIYTCSEFGNNNLIIYFYSTNYIMSDDEKYKTLCVLVHEINYFKFFAVLFEINKNICDKLIDKFSKSNKENKELIDFVKNIN